MPGEMPRMHNYNIYPVERCVDCGNVEAGVGSIRTHPRTPLCIGPRRGRQGRRPELKTMDDSKPTANWDRSVQSIHEEVGTGGQCGITPLVKVLKIPLSDCDLESHRSRV